MKANDKNRMPKGMILGCWAAMLACAGISALAYVLLRGSSFRAAVVLLADAGILAGACFTARCLQLYKALDYNRTRKSFLKTI